MLRKKDNPAVPVTPDEQIESTHAAYEAGSALVHIHVRDKDEKSLIVSRAVCPIYVSNAELVEFNQPLFRIE